MQYEHVFSPFRIGNIEVKNRIATPPQLSEMATQDGFVSREMIEYHEALARGGVGVVTLGDTMITPYAGHYSQLYLGDDRVIAGLSNLVEAVHKYGAKLSVELNFSVMSSTILGGKNPLEPQQKMERVKAPDVMDQNAIDQIKVKFADAAYRCMTAGFQLIMLHGAHGQPLAQFLSPLSNKRTDKYGGSLENRARFAMEVIDAVRDRVGNRLAIEYRVSGSELDPKGMDEGATIEFLKLIQDKVDGINVSLGVFPAYIAYTMQPTYFPREYNVHRAAAIKQALHIPVTCVGGINSLAAAERIITEGKADRVAMGRALIADPELVNKTYYGKADNVIPCLRCNYCGGRTSQSLPIRCAVNPVRGRETVYNYILPAKIVKKVIVVGGGPAGMEAALVASSRGHKVTLFEKETELGGALRYASAPSFKADMKRYLSWMITQVQKSPVEVIMNTRATVQGIKKLKPDVLIIAAGAAPYRPEITGINQSNVIFAGDACIGTAVTGNRIIVAGGGFIGWETALHLAMQGKKVTIIDERKKEELAQDFSMVLRLRLMELLNEQGVVIKPQIRVEKINGKSVSVVDGSGKKERLPADNVILASGAKSLEDTVKPFREFALKNSIEFHAIGDCADPGKVENAVHGGFNVTAEL